MLKNRVDDSIYDVVVVGAGPAGISAALRLADRHGRKVALVESGSIEESLAATKLSQVVAQGDLASEYFPVHAQRRLGGTSSVWSGFCTTIEERGFLNGEWPIARAEFAPYYEDAADILELPVAAYREPYRAIIPGASVVYRPYYLSPPVRFADKYGERLREHTGVDFYLDHTCTELLHARGTVESLSLVSTRNRSRSRLQARSFILACGGIGNPRLLWLSGLSASEALGRYFMEHPHIYQAGNLSLDKVLIDGAIGNLSAKPVVHALQLTDEYCLANGLLNFTVSFEANATATKMLLARSRTVYVSKAVIRAEMRALPANRVYLGDALDSIGQPITRIDFAFNYQPLARETWSNFARVLLVSGIGRAGAPRSSYPEITGGGHYMGTTRMGIDLETSVVDGDCKVHDIGNLFVAGSSVFPSSGAANPTFTIVALALRLADHVGALPRGAAV